MLVGGRTPGVVLFSVLVTVTATLISPFDVAVSAVTFPNVELLLFDTLSVDNTLFVSGAGSRFGSDEFDVVTGVVESVEETNSAVELLLSGSLAVDVSDVFGGVTTETDDVDCGEEVNALGLC